MNETISCEDLRERTVIDAAGLAIGRVDSLLLDPASWKVKALRVSLRREVTEAVGAPRSFFRKATVDVPTESVQSVGDAVLLRLKAHDLRDDGRHDPQDDGSDRHVTGDRDQG
jgi:sporulation protein YlmC with PRC-barrel domain